MESLEMNFWKGKKVFLTGHTGFKGSWITMYLDLLGAQVIGYALKPPTIPSIFELCGIKDIVGHNIGDVRDISHIKKVMSKSRPDIVIHMAAQPLVRDSYKIPVDTFDINVMGTVNVLEAVRSCRSVKAFVNVTTDKCYENLEKKSGYIESDPLGGYDPYSASKACSEIVTASYRNSYFNPKAIKQHGVGIATARAGNVIGGGDWATDRLIPDIIRSILKKEKVLIRNPKAVRPWQHVLEPLTGYLMLAEKLYKNGAKYSDGWNFGPDRSDAKPVEWIVDKLCSKWGQDALYVIDKAKHPHETGYLYLDSTKARAKLGWSPRWSLNTALEKVVDWTKYYKRHKDLKEKCREQIKEYLSA
jgi:CDP-glucose 4,6-dehydratase